MSRWTVEAGRQIYFDGRPFIHIGREGDARPVEADGAAHLIADLFNRDGVTPDTIYERHMGRPRRRRTSEAPRARASGQHVAEMISMTYGSLPDYREFMHDIRRTNPEDDKPYWPRGQDFRMELVTTPEIELAESYGELFEFETMRPGYAYGFRGDESIIYGFLGFLRDQFEEEGNETAGDLASSIMYSLGYEWI